MNTLIYSLGDKADNILCSLDLTEADWKKYSLVKDKFDAHFVQWSNIIFECAKFSIHKQEEGEFVDAFIADLHSLVEHCAYGSLHNEMICDGIVMEIRNSALSEGLQLDAALTLESAVTHVRQAEAVKLQQPLLRAGCSGGKLDTPVGAVQKGSVTPK